MDGKRTASASKQILTAFIATIPNFTYGIQIGWLSPMRAYLVSSEDHDPISSNAISWLAAALPLSAMLSIPIFSYSSDRIGRKWSMVAISVLDSISWIMKLTSVTATSLIIARVIAGLAASGCFVVIPAYIKEISEDSWRGSLASLTMTVCKLGVIFVYAVGMLLTYAGNQWVYLGVALAHVLLFSMMPESPNFLLKIGREKAASRTIAWLRGLHRSDDAVSQEVAKLREEQRRFDELPAVTVRSIVQDKASFSALRMTLVLMAMQTLSGCFALMNFAADVFSRAGAQWSPNTLALFMGALQLAGSFFTTVSIERFGRKIPLFFSSLAVSVCMTTLATCFYLDSAASWPRVAAVCLALFAYGVGLAPVPMVIMAEVFTFQVRTKLAGVCMAFSFFCSSLTVLFYTPIAHAFGEYAVFYIFATVTLLGAVYTVLWVPETKGKSLQQIREYWKKPEPVYV